MNYGLCVGKYSSTIGDIRTVTLLSDCLATISLILFATFFIRSYTLTLTQPQLTFAMCNVGKIL